MLQCTLHILHQGGLYHMFHIRFYLTFDVTSVKVLKEQQVWPVTFTKRPQRERVLRPDCIKNKNERLNRRFSGLCCRLLSLNISVGISAAPSVSGLTLWFNSGHHGTPFSCPICFVLRCSFWSGAPSWDNHTQCSHLCSLIIGCTCVQSTEARLFARHFAPSLMFERSEWAAVFCVGSSGSMIS